MAIFLIFGIFIIRAFSSNVCIVAQDKTFNLDFNSLASRTVYSPDCFALEKFYQDGNKHYLVDAGTIDVSKVSGRRLESCISFNPEMYDISIKNLDTGEYLMGNSKTCTSKTKWRRSESFLVSIIDETGELRNGVETFCLKFNPKTVKSEVCKK